MTAPAPPKPARKRERRPAVKRDPVVAALIVQLPAEGAAWPRHKRVNWLRMMAMALDGAHGLELPIAIDNPGGSMPTPRQDMQNMQPQAANAAAAPPISAPAEPDEQRYYIDKQGFARGHKGERIEPTDVPAGETIEDERDDDNLEAIKWRKGTWPVAAYKDRNLIFVKT